MPKPNFARADVFNQKPTAPAPQPGAVPYINAQAMGAAVYEGLSMADFVDPTEKENQQLKGQLADLMQQLEGRTSDLVAQDGTLMVQGFQFTPTGLIAPEGMTSESWEQIGLMLFKLEGSIQWLIGDWLVYGVDLAYGDITQIAAALSRESQTLYNYATVSRSVEFSRRRENLSFGHHEAVAKLDPDTQNQCLAHAETEGLNRSDFRKWLKGDKPALSSGGDISLKTLTAGVDKFMQRDPSTLKPSERSLLLERFAEIERQIADYKRRLGVR